ncbi:unnamed protein product [Caenorhabditis sp. 36 PRJEB53466]|nr:unnamed protein product [Caenorhabditis sp. 36 PRJEB53466]
MITFSSVTHLCFSFILSKNDDRLQCYELELENCFREAFLSATHPLILQKRSAFLWNNESHRIIEKVLDKKKHVRQLKICHDVRKFSSCFIYPGCSDQQAANIASVQYHMVFGKKLPMHVFLAYRGYGRELCEQQCSQDVFQHCKKKMSHDEQKEEEDFLFEISSIIVHILPNRDTMIACSRFNQLLANLMRLRRVHCDDIARCTCTDVSIQQGVDGCNSGCEHLLHMNLDKIISNSKQTGSFSTLYSLYMCWFFIAFSRFTGSWRVT